MAVTDAARGQVTVLYEEHYWAVLRFATRRLRDGEAARDIAAETFAIAWRRIGDMPAFPLPWLYGIARHLACNEVRRALRAERLTTRLASEPPQHDASAGEEGVVLQTLGRLSERDQEVLRLSAWEDLTGAEMAQVLRCSNATAAVRLHRATQAPGRARGQPAPQRQHRNASAECLEEPVMSGTDETMLLRSADQARHTRDDALDERASRDLESILTDDQDAWPARTPLPAAPRRRHRRLAGSAAACLVLALATTVGVTQLGSAPAYAVATPTLLDLPDRGSSAGTSLSTLAAQVERLPAAATNGQSIRFSEWALHTSIDGKSVTSAVIPRDVSLDINADGSDTERVTTGAPQFPTAQAREETCSTAKRSSRAVMGSSMFALQL